MPRNLPQGSQHQRVLYAFALQFFDQFAASGLVYRTVFRVAVFKHGLIIPAAAKGLNRFTFVQAQRKTEHDKNRCVRFKKAN
jgi:hypothetical protein